MDKVIEILLEIKNKINELGMYRKEVFSLHDFTKYACISVDEGYKLTAANKIKFYRPGGKMIYIKREDAISYLLQNPVDNCKDVQKKATNNLITSKTAA